VVRAGLGILVFSELGGKQHGGEQEQAPVAAAEERRPTYAGLVSSTAKHAELAECTGEDPHRAYHTCLAVEAGRRVEKYRVEEQCHGFQAWETAARVDCLLKRNDRLVGSC